MLAVVLVGCVAAVTLGSTLARDGSSAPPGPIPPRSLLPSGPPAKQVLSRHAGLDLYVPIEQDLITAIAYHPYAASRAFSLEPAGKQVNADLVRRLWRRIVGEDDGGLRYYVTDGATDAVDIGAHQGTIVYAPVDGQVVSLAPEVVNGRTYAHTVGIQPGGDPSVVVNVAHVRLQYQADGQTRVRVGQRVAAAATQLGTVADEAQVLTSDVRRYVSDSGNNAMITVEPAPVLEIP